MSIIDIEAINAQIKDIEKDLHKADFYRTNLELAKSIASRKVEEATETIELLKSPGIIVSLPEYGRVKKDLASALKDLKNSERDLETIKTAIVNATAKLEALKANISKIKEMQANNVRSFRKESPNEQP